MKYRISDVASINESSISKSTYIGSVNYVDTSSVISGNFNGYRHYPSISEAPSRARRLVSKEDTVISTVRPNMKHVGFISSKSDCIYSTGFAVVSPKKDKIDPYYLYLFLSSNRVTEVLQSIGETSTSTYPSVKPSDIGNLVIDMPPLDEQHLIANRIRLIDEKKNQNSQINANLLNLANTLFKYYFPDINTGTDKIGDYIKNFDKLRKPLSKKQRSEIPGKYRYIGATSVNDHIDKYNFDGIYLLLGEDGTVQDEYGFPILQYTFGKFWPNNHAHVLQGKNVSTEWLYLYFSQRNISGIVTGAVQKKVSQKNMNSLKFKLPDSQELKKFDKIIQPLFSKIRSTKLENYQLEELKRVLLTKLF